MTTPPVGLADYSIMDKLNPRGELPDAIGINAYLVVEAYEFSARANKHYCGSRPSPSGDTFGPGGKRCDEHRRNSLLRLPLRMSALTSTFLTVQAAEGEHGIPGKIRGWGRRCKPWTGSSS
jgi:hypothetical protein